MSGAERTKARFEHPDPILRIKDMSVSLRYYVEVLGFKNADWGDDNFTHAARDTNAADSYQNLSRISF